MKRFLSTSFIALALVVSALGAAPSAGAAVVCSASTEGQACTAGSVSGTCQYNGDDGWQCLASSVTNPSAGSAPKTVTDFTVPTTFAKVMTFIASLFAWLLGVAAITLDNAVYYTIVVMGDYVHNINGIGIAWRVLRDIGNILLIFGFIFAGISIILNTDLYGYGKKMLPMLLVAAVFINFSLFISEAVIDVGNLFATQFYTQINGGNPAQPIGYAGSDQISKEPISSKLMDQLGLTTIYGRASKPAEAEKLFENSGTIAFMSIILFMVAAFVFFALAFILIARFVILLFLIILAPIGFAGLAVPKLKSTADKWWGALFEQTITAPVLLLLLYVALLVITDAKFLIGSAGDYTGFVERSGVSTNLVGFASVILSFLIAMGLLLAVVIVSKKMSAFGGDIATKLGGKLSFGVTAFAGRRTLGRASGALSRSVRSSRLGRTEVGRTLLKATDFGAKSSFDVRGVKAGGGLGAFGLHAGEAQKGGYKAIEDQAVKDRVAHADSLKMTGSEERAKAAMAKELSDIQKAFDEGTIDEKEYKHQVAELKKREVEVKGLLGFGKADTRFGRFLGAKNKVGDKKLTLGDLENLPQEQYAERLASGSGFVKGMANAIGDNDVKKAKEAGMKLAGLAKDSLFAGVKTGALAGTGATAVGVGIGTAAATGGTAFAAGAGLYAASVAPRAGGRAAAEIRKKRKETDINKLAKALANADKPNTGTPPT